MRSVAPYRGSPGVEQSISNVREVHKQAVKCNVLLHLQGIGLSSFLESNAGPGQRTLAGFIQRDSSGAPARYHQPETDPQGWKQTFLDAQTRQEIAK